MTASAADAARFTTDGVVIRAPTSQAAADAIKARHPDARDTGDREIEMFFVNPAHAQILINERFAIQSQSKPGHHLIEIEEALDLGGTVPIAPNVPTFAIVDDANSSLERTRAYTLDRTTDRFSIETLG